jgi:hypothetical protein
VNRYERATTLEKLNPEGKEARMEGFVSSRVGLPALSGLLLLLSAGAASAASTSVWDFTQFPQDFACDDSCQFQLEFGNWRTLEGSSNGIGITISAEDSNTISVRDGYLFWGNVGEGRDLIAMSPFLADFSVPLSTVSVEMVDAFADHRELGDGVVFLEAYDAHIAGDQASGNLLGRVEIDATSDITALVLNAVGIQAIRFGVELAACPPGSNYCYVDPPVWSNSAQVTRIAAAAIPEPRSTLLLMLGLGIVGSAMAWRDRSKSGYNASTARRSLAEGSIRWAHAAVNGLPLVRHSARRRRSLA